MNNPMVVEVIVPLPVQDVWMLCTTEEGLTRWWWPQFDDTTYSIDPRPLHTYRFVSRQAGIGVHGDYIVVEKYVALEFSWVWEDDGPGTSDHVRVTLTPVPSGTRVRVTHTMVEPSQAGHDDYRRGWAENLRRLSDLAVMAA